MELCEQERRHDIAYSLFRIKQRIIIIIISCPGIPEAVSLTPAITEKVVKHLLYPDAIAKMREYFPY